MGIRFGILLSMAYDDSTAELEVRNRLTQVRLAADVGLDAVCMGQHFVTTPLHYFQPLSMAGRLAEVSGPMQVGVTVALAPFAHPVSLAEEAATIDIITGGRLILGLGQGWRPDERRAFGVADKDVLRRYLDLADALPLLWSGEQVSFQGRSFHFTDVTLGARPLQRPHPPLWMAGSREAGVRRIARRAMPWLGSAQLPTRAVVAQANQYEEEFRKHHGELPADRPLLRNLVVGTSREAAMSEAMQALGEYYAAFKDWGLWKDLIPDGRFDTPEDLIGEHVVVGDPDSCVEQLSAILDATDRNFLIFKVEWPGMAHDAVLRCIELLGTRVAPQIRSRYADR